MTARDRISSGVFRNNPVAVLLVGLCPAAAVTTRVIDALWMSLGVFSVLILSRLCLSILGALRGESPEAATGDVRGEGPMPGRWLGALLLSSCLTACFELILLAFAPGESASLGIYTPLIAVNCIVLDRIDPRGERSSIPASLLDACGLGLGFALALVLISGVRESLGAGTITLFAAGTFGGTIEIHGLSSAPARAIGYAGGGLLCLGYLAGAARLLRRGSGTADEGAASS